jgi:glycolate oxidase
VPPVAAHTPPSSPSTTALVTALRNALSPSQVIAHPDELIVYECDGFTIPRARPLAVVFPTSTDQVAAAVKACCEHNIAILPRGSGTGLTGGIVAVTPSVQISTARMNKILHIDLRNRYALVEAGVPNLSLSTAIASSPLHYAPDPSSQRASTIGGNVATNAGGLHTLKYGVTVNHILGVEVVLSDGTIHTIGGPQGGHDIGPDLTGLLCGTEGTLAIITKIWCRLIPKPTAFRTALAIFNDTQKACQSVADIIAAGIVPAALEMMDGPMIGIIEDTFHLGFPKSAQALLVLEVDGQEQGLDEDLAQIETICKKNDADFQATSDPKRRADLWSARKRAFGAIGRVSPSYCTQDACVPRSKLPEVIAKIGDICARHQLRITNVFHAGDGNVHPILMYDDSDENSVRAALAASAEILRYCISVGGTLTGEHGVGIEKLEFMRDMFSPDDLAAMHKIRVAFVGESDAMNPFKSLPRPGVEIDLLHPQRHVPQ